MPTTTSRAYLEIIATDRATRVMGGLEATFKRFGSQLLGLAGLGGGLYGLKRAFDANIEAAMESEKVQTNLASSLRATGEYSDETMGRLIRFAKSMQDVTTWSDEAVLGLAEYVHTLGVGAYQIEEATRMTLGLSKALRVDEQAAAKMAAAAMEGHFEKFARYIPAIKDARTEAERFALVEEKVRIGLGLATGELGGVTGATENLKNQLHETQVSIGQFFIPAWEGAIVVLREGSIALREVLGELKKLQDAMPKPGMPLMEIVPPGYKKEDFLPPVKEMEDWNRTLDQWPGAIPRIHSMEMFLQQTEAIRQAQEDYNIEFDQWLRGADQIDDYDQEWQFLVEHAMDYSRALEEAAGKQQYINDLMQAATEADEKRRQAAEAAIEQDKRRIDSLIKEATEIKKLGEIGLEATVTFKRGFGEAFADVMMKVETLEDAFRSLGLAIIRSVLVNTGENIAGMVNKGLLSVGANIASALFGGPAAAAAPTWGGAAHAGGIIGETSFPMRMLPAWAFETAPRLHAGLMPDEFPAILQRGEPVFPKGTTFATNSAQSTTVIIKNEGAEKLEVSKAESYVVSDQRILEVTVRAMQSNLQYRRNMRGS